jgi:murein L,D-transpeptidase YafK
MEMTIEKQTRAHKKFTLSRSAALALLIICIGACTHSPPAEVSAPLKIPAPEAKPVVAIAPAPTEVDKPSTMEESLHIVVSKAERSLTVYRNDEIVQRYPVGLGFRPEGRKRWVGDGRTPEGRYAVAIKNPRSRYFLSLGLNYPTPSDGMIGFREGRITWKQYLAIEDAFDRGAVPPWNTRLGGEIFIHGDGATSDWTKGCIALDDADMKQLYSLVSVGTPVIILP